jgi:hypothetical protein
MSKLTPWFSGAVHPSRKGVYIATMSRQTFYRYWDGRHWHHGAYDLDLAMNAARRGGKWDSVRYPMKRWRGLAAQPKSA